MKIHSTNYYDTFIEVAEDCPALAGEVPPEKDEKTIARLQFEMISQNPYKYNSDEVIFGSIATKKDISMQEFEKERDLYFSKGQACLRSSPLTKRYGWGVHANSDGKIALYGRGSEEYQSWVADAKIKKVKGMRSKK